MSPLYTAEFASGPIPYTALPTGSEDPPQPEYTPTPSYSGNGKATVLPSDNLSMDGSLKSQIAFYERELEYLRSENIRLTESNVRLKDHEIQQSRLEMTRKRAEEDDRGLCWYLGACVLVIFAFAALFTR